MAAADAGRLLLPAQDSIHLTEGQNRTLCISAHLPECMRPPDHEWCIDQFELGVEALYQGKTSLLHAAVHKSSGARVAIKQYKKKRLTALARYQIEREVCIHIALQHPHIIQLLAAFEDPEQVYLVQEFAPGGDLFEALKHQAAMKYDEAEAVGRFIAPCLEALDYLRQRGCIHRDIKPENILLGAGGAVKLADFGLAINRQQERPVTRAGTLDYMAPEVLVCPDKRRPEDNKDMASLSYDEQVDAWAAGCLAAELISGSPPFESETRSATYQLIMYREPRLPARLSELAKSFIAASLVKSPKDRASVQQLLQHDWITSNRHAYQQQGATVEGLASSVQQPAAAGITAAALQAAEQAAEAGAARTPAAGPCASDTTDTASSQPAACSPAGSGSSSRTDAGSSGSELPAASGNADKGLSPAAVGNVASVQQPCTSDCSSVAASTVAALPAAAAWHSSTAAPAIIGAGGYASSGCAANGVIGTAGAACDAGSPTSSRQTPCSLHEQAPAASGATEAAAGQAAANSQEAAAAAAALAAGPAANRGAAALAEHEEAPAGVADPAQMPGAGGGSSPKQGPRLARASTHRGHHLHKLFYPHDKHRRSSFCNTQWDDLIDTSAHSFSSCSPAAAAGSILAAVDTANAGTSPVPMAGSGADGFNTSTSSCLAHQAGLAALPDAGLQAPPAVVSQVLSTAASGALHLLAANDLEDLIAPNPTPCIALSCLGLVPSDSPAATASASCHSSLSGGVCAVASCAQSLKGAALAVGALSGGGDVVTKLAGGSLDDYIATSASPGCSVSRVSVLVSRNSSTSSLTALAASAQQPPPASPRPPASAAAAVSAGIGAGVSSPRTSRVRATAAAGASAAEAAGHTGLQPLTPRNGANLGLNSDGSAADAGVKTSMRQVESGTCFNLMIPGSHDTTLADGVNADVQHTPCAVPPIDQAEDVLVFPAGSRKSVVWADNTATAALEGSKLASPGSAAAAAAAAAEDVGAAAVALLQHAGSNIAAINAAIPDGSSISNRSCLSPRMQAAWQSGFQQHDGSATSVQHSNSVPSSSQRAQPLPVPALQITPSQPWLQQVRSSTPVAAASNFYCPPSGVLSSDVGLSCHAKGSLASKSAAMAGFSLSRAASSPEDPRTATAAAPGAIGQLHVADVPAAAGGGSSVARLQRQHVSCTGHLTSSSSGSPFESAVPFTTISNMQDASPGVSRSCSALIQAGRLQDGAGSKSNSALEVYTCYCRRSSSNAEGSNPLGAKPHRRCRGSSSGTELDLEEVWALRQHAKSFTGGCRQPGCWSNSGAGASGGAAWRVSGDAEGDVGDVLVAARQQAKSFTADTRVGLAASTAGAGNSRRHGALAPIKAQSGAAVNGLADMLRSRSNSMTGGRPFPWAP